MSADSSHTPVETVVVGAGQAGLSVAHHLQRLGRSAVVLDAAPRVGDVWRSRWDSLRLFTPARFDGLDGLRFPGDPHAFPTKDEMADYLEAYAARLDLPVRLGTRVERLSRPDERFLVETNRGCYEASNVVVAIGSFQRPRVPAFASELDPGIVQLHSSAYRRPDQLRDGPVLLVGAGNSGSEIAMELSATRRVTMAGRSTGSIPFRLDSRLGRHLGVPFVVGFLFPRVLTVRTPMGRRMRAEVLAHGGPLIRVKPRDLRRAGVERMPRVRGVEQGRPVLEDGRSLDVANVVWCTGYHPGFDWIDLPVHGELEPRHRSGIVDDEPGLYFVGLLFLDSLASEMVNGVGRDAARVAAHLDARMAGAGEPAGRATLPSRT